MTGASAAMALPSRRGLARKPRGMPVQKLAIVGGEPGPTRRDLGAMTLQPTDKTHPTDKTRPPNPTQQSDKTVRELPAYRA